MIYDPREMIRLIYCSSSILVTSSPMHVHHSSSLPPGRLLPTWAASDLHLQLAMEWGMADRPGVKELVTLIDILPGSKEAEGYSPELSRSPRRLVRCEGEGRLSTEGRMPKIVHHILQFGILG